MSCGGRAELELEASLDRRGTTVGTELSVLHGIFLPGLVFDFQPTHKNTDDLRRVCQETGLAGFLGGAAVSRIDQHLGRILLLPRWFQSTPLPQLLSKGRLETPAEFKIFLAQHAH